jgi:hypothetical protein
MIRPKRAGGVASSSEDAAVLDSFVASFAGASYVGKAVSWVRGGSTAAGVGVGSAAGGDLYVQVPRADAVPAPASPAPTMAGAKRLRSEKDSLLAELEQSAASGVAPSLAAAASEYARSTSLFVGTLNARVAEGELEAACGRFGRVTSLRIHVNRHAAAAGGTNTAFVHFASRRDAEAALAGLMGTDFYGDRIRLAWAQAESDRDPPARGRDRDRDDRGRDRDRNDRDRDHDRGRDHDRDRDRSRDRNRDRGHDRDDRDDFYDRDRDCDHDRDHDHDRDRDRDRVRVPALPRIIVHAPEDADLRAQLDSLACLIATCKQRGTSVEENADVWDHPLAGVLGQLENERVMEREAVYFRWRVRA